MRHLLFLFLFVSYSAAAGNIYFGEPPNIVYNADKVTPWMQKFAKECNNDSECIQKKIKMRGYKNSMQHRVHSCYMLLAKCYNEFNHNVCDSITMFAKRAKERPKDRYYDCIFVVNASEDELWQAFKENFNVE